MVRHARTKQLSTGGPACQGHRIDFTEITRRTDPNMLAEARRACATCPVLDPCLVYLQTTETIGMAGGMLDHERTRWRQDNGYQADQTTIADVSEAAELEGPLLGEEPLWTPTGRLTDHAIDLIRRLTDTGHTAREIVERLAHAGITKASVAYVRRTYLTGPVTERRRRHARSTRPGYTDHDVILAWAEQQGIPRRRGRRERFNAPDEIVTAYHRVHP